MQSRAEKDTKALVIARALGIFVLVLAGAVLLLVVAARLGLDALEPGAPVAMGVAALLSLLFLVRHRND